MKKILILITSIIAIFSLTGCNSFDLKEELKMYVNTEVPKYIFSSSTNQETNEVTYYDTLHNDTVTALLLLRKEYTIKMENILESAGSSLESVTNYYLEKEINGINTAFNMILVYILLDLDYSDLEDYLEGVTISDLYYTNSDGTKTFDNYAALTAINCFNLLQVNPSLKRTLISKFDNINSFDYMDCDLAALIVVALQNDVKKDYLDYLYKNIKPNGVENFSGEISGTSTAQVLIALMSQGVIYQNNKLIDTVLSFKVENGFKEYLDDTESDYSYASPKAFKSLVCGYLFESTSNKIVIYQ